VNILFAMQSPEYFRFYDSTVRELAARGHRVTIAVNKQNEAKPARFGDLDDEGSVVALGVIPRRDDRWRTIGRRLRGVVDFARYLHPRLAEATALRARMKHKVLPRGFHWLDRIPRLSVPWLGRLLRLLRSMEQAIPSSPSLERFVRSAQADVVLVSPLIDAASDQVELVKSAQALGVPVGACIASWDNLTNKGLMRVTPDAVFVWNEAQRQETLDYHDVPAARVVTTGAQVFDRWFDRRPGPRDVFCARVGLPVDRPFLLYTCSSSFISLSPAELEFVRGWIAAVRAEPALADMAILIRPHPYNGAAWERADLGEWPDVSVWPRGRYNPLDEEHRHAFFDSLHHSAAVVGINTSAMIEAAIIGRPVLSFVADRFAGTQEGTLHFHYLLPENGGFLRMARSVAEHIEQLQAVVVDAPLVRRQTEHFVATFIRPHGVDRPCTPILADAIEALGRHGEPAREAGPRRPSPGFSRLWRPVLVAANAYAYGCTVLMEPDVRRKLRKTAASKARKGARAVTRAPRQLQKRITRRRKRVTTAPGTTRGSRAKRDAGR
jgi:hypothetical protein